MRPRSPRPSEPRRRRPWWLIIGLVAVTGAASWAVLPWFRIGPDVLAMIGAFNSYGAALSALLALVLIIVVGSRRARLPRPQLIIGLLAMVIVGTAVLQSPHWIPNRRPARTGPTFTLASINLHLGLADADSITAATGDVDVVAFTEITERTAMRLAATSFAVRFPYFLADVELPGRGAEGTMIYSRWPLSPMRPLVAGTVHENWITTTEVPGIGTVTVVAVHAQRPFLFGTNWLPEHRLITDALPRGPLTVVAGDFNAAPDQVQIAGLASAADLTGSGWIRTFPVDPRFPRLLRIDHVLLGDGLTATSLSTLAVERTDHLGLRTVIAAAS